MKKSISSGLINNSFLIVMLYLTLIFSGTLLISIFENKDIIKNNITVFLEDFNFSELKNNLINKKSLITVKDLKFTVLNKENKINLTFFPLFDSNNSLTYIIVVKNAKEELLEEKIIIQEESINKKISGVSKFFKKIMKNIGKFKKEK